MSDFLAETPSLARPYCPVCEPDADPCREILDVRWCDEHTPVRDGADDAAVRSDAYLSGSAEAGGEANRRWCEVIHGAGRRSPHLGPSGPGLSSRRRDPRRPSRTADA